MERVGPGPSRAASLLTDAFLEGRWRAEDLAERGAAVLGCWPAWLNALSFSVAARSRIRPTDDRLGLIGFIDQYLTEHGHDPHLITPAEPDVAATTHRRSVVADRWPVASLSSTVALAQRLELSDGQLAWMADVRGLERSVAHEKLRHYRYRWVARRRGLPRLIEAPKARLKEVQRWVLREILDQVPPHDAACGFVAGRSVIDHAARHSGHGIVLRLDLRDFFASVSAGRVYGIFEAIGYSHSVAHTLTGLCTNTVPEAVWSTMNGPQRPDLVQRRFWLSRQLATPHLPQGAPTSPALANLAAFALDRRLTALAHAFSLIYSRYADDLTFSGRRLSARASHDLLGTIATILREEGFGLNPDKTLVRTAAQRQVVTGVVVNAHPNIARTDFDQTKAILHRLAQGQTPSPELARTVDLEAHLRGRVAWITSLNPNRGAKLMRLLDAIDWTSVG